MSVEDLANPRAHSRAHSRPDSRRDPGPDSQRTLSLEIEFDGTDFEGWQRQSEGRTVQAEVEAALERILGTHHAVVGCGRTDAGVHARMMVASFRTDHAMPSDKLARALDAVLPADVGVLAARDEDPAFHARRDALWKWYRYRILVSRRKRPLSRREVLRMAVAPEVAALAAAAAPLVGRHDFRSFANSGSSPGRTTVRTLHTLSWSREGALLRLDAVGDGFLYKMVRTLVGTMLRAAAGPDPGAETARVLAAHAREAAGAALPATGLTLMAVGLRGRPAPGWVPERLLQGVESEALRATGGES